MRTSRALTDTATHKRLLEDTRRRLGEVWRQARERRAKLVAQLDMADEFIWLMSASNWWTGLTTVGRLSSARPRSSRHER